MSWDAVLYDDRGHIEGDWNFTHNLNGAIAAALKAAGYGDTEMCGGPLGRAIGPAWYDRLNGMTGPDGARMLADARDEMVKNRDTYLPYNPDNGWGDVDAVCQVFSKMIASVPEWPTLWRCDG